MKIEEIAIQAILVNPHKVLDRNRIERHMLDLERKGSLFPINVRRFGQGLFVVSGNGRHRLAAYREMRFDVIPCWVEEGVEG